MNNNTFNNNNSKLNEEKNDLEESGGLDFLKKPKINYDDDDKDDIFGKKTSKPG